MKLRSFGGYCASLKGGSCEPFHPGLLEETYNGDEDQYFAAGEDVYCSVWAGADGVDVISKENSGILGLVNVLLSYVAWALSGIVNLLLDLVYFLMHFAFDIPDEIQAAWRIFRDFTNAIIAAALIAVSVMSILRIKMDNYAIKKSLPRIIIALVLVNLSWVMGLLVMDIGQIAFKAVENIPGSIGVTDTSIGKLIDVDAFENINNLADTPDDYQVISQGSIFVWMLASIVLLLVIITPICQMIIAFLIRIVVLWVLMVVSPLAWIGFVIPEARAETWSKYWTQLMTMSFMPAKVELFLVIGFVLNAVFLNAKAELKLGSSSSLEVLNAEIASGLEFKTFIQRVLLTLAAAVLIKLAAKEGLKSDFAEFAMNWGGKLGSLVKLGADKWMPAAAKSVAGTTTDAAKLRGKKMWLGLQDKGAKWREDAANFEKEHGRFSAGTLLKRTGAAVTAPTYASWKKRVEMEGEHVDKKLAGHASDAVLRTHKGKTGYDAVEFAQNRLNHLTNERDEHLNTIDLRIEATQKDSSLDAQQKAARIEALQTEKTRVENEWKDKLHPVEEQLKATRDRFNKFAQGTATNQFRFAQAASSAARTDAEGMADTQERLGKIEGDDATALL